MPPVWKADLTGRIDQPHNEAAQQGCDGPERPGVEDIGALGIVAFLQIEGRPEWVCKKFMGPRRALITNEPFYREEIGKYMMKIKEAGLSTARSTPPLFSVRKNGSLIQIDHADVIRKPVCHFDCLAQPILSVDRL